MKSKQMYKLHRTKPTKSELTLSLLYDTVLLKLNCMWQQFGLLYFLQYVMQFSYYFFLFFNMYKNILAPVT